MGILDLLFSPTHFFRSIEHPLVPLRPRSLFDFAEVSFQRNLTFQLNPQSRSGVSLRSSRDFYRHLRWFEGPDSNNVSRCIPPREYFDFEEGVIQAGPPSPPQQNCFSGILPDQYGWFDSYLSMPGSSRIAKTYRPDVETCALRPLVVCFHGTGGGSDSLSNDLFNEDEVHRVFGNHAIIFILEARDYMPEDWEHWGFSYTRFWNTSSDRGDHNRDILFVDALIRAAIRDYGADPRRVYLMGHSNGGFAATQVGIALRDLVRGVAVSSAGWVEHPPKRRMIFDSTDCGTILERGRDYFSRVDSRFPFPRPFSAFPQDGGPAFFLRGDSLDPDVSAYYSCVFDQELRDHGIEVKTQIINWRNPDNPSEGYHFVDRAFLRDAWEYLSHLEPR